MEYYVLIRPQVDGGQHVWFGDYFLGALDLDTGLLQPESSVEFKKTVTHVLKGNVTCVLKPDIYKN